MTELMCGETQVTFRLFGDQVSSVAVSHNGPPRRQSEKSPTTGLEMLHAIRNQVDSMIGGMLPDDKTAYVIGSIPWCLRELAKEVQRAQQSIDRHKGGGPRLRDSRISWVEAEARWIRSTVESYSRLGGKEGDIRGDLIESIRCRAGELTDQLFDRRAARSRQEIHLQLTILELFGRRLHPSRAEKTATPVAAVPVEPVPDPLVSGETGTSMWLRTRILDRYNRMRDRHASDIHATMSWHRGYLLSLQEVLKELDAVEDLCGRTQDVRAALSARLLQSLRSMKPAEAHADRHAGQVAAVRKVLRKDLGVARHRVLEAGG